MSTACLVYNCCIVCSFCWQVVLCELNSTRLWADMSSVDGSQTYLSCYVQCRILCALHIYIWHKCGNNSGSIQISCSMFHSLSRSFNVLKVLLLHKFKECNVFLVDFLINDIGLELFNNRDGIFVCNLCLTCNALHP